MLVEKIALWIDNYTLCGFLTANSVYFLTVLACPDRGGSGLSV
jgi:hypothetical protein